MQKLFSEIHGRNVSQTRKKGGRGSSEQILGIIMRLISNRVQEKKNVKIFVKEVGGGRMKS